MKKYFTAILIVFCVMAAAESGMCVEKVEAKSPAALDAKIDVSSWKLKPFENNSRSIALMYPSEWFVKENVQPNIYQLFLSKEKVEAPGDVYLTGISLAKVPNARAAVGLSAQDAYGVANEWLKRYVAAINTSKTVTVAFPLTPVKVGADTGYLTELSFKDKNGRMLHNFNVILYKDNTLVNIIMESTVEDFDQYRNLFRQIIDGMKVF